MGSSRTDRSERIDRERRRRAKAAAVSTKHARPRLEPWRPKRPGENIIELAISPGITINEPDAITKMRRWTHDGLIRLTGRRRRSAVNWYQCEGSEACKKFLTDLYATETSDPLDAAQSRGEQDVHVAQYFEFIDEHPDDCVLIIATCEAIR